MKDKNKEAGDCAVLDVVIKPQSVLVNNTNVVFLLVILTIIAIFFN